MIALVLLSLAGFCAWAVTRWRWPIESTLLPLTSAIMGVLYLGGLAGWLRPTAWVLLALGLLLGATAVALHGPALRAVRLRPGTAILVLAGAFIAIWLRNARFVGWDEFSHWAYVTQQIIRTHALPTAGSDLIFKDYPPATALFHYFWMLGGPLREGSAFIAHGALALAAMAALWTSRQWAVVATVAFVQCAAFFTFSRGLHTLDVDQLVGLWFGCGVAGYLLSTDPGRVVRLLPVLFVLPLIKKVGLPLSLFAGVAVVCDQLVFQRRERAPVYVLALLVLMPAAGGWSWSRHIDGLQANRTHAMRASSADIRRAFSPDATEHERETVRNFSRALTDIPIGSPQLGTVLEPVAARVGFDVSTSGLSIAGWAGVYAVFIVVLGVIQSNWASVRRLAVFHGWLAVCAATYVAGLLVLYLFAFSPYEGVRLASYARYVGILGLGMTAILVAWILLGMRTTGWRHRGAVALLAIVAAGSVYAMGRQGLRFVWYGPTPLSAEREMVFRTVARVPTLPLDARVYVLWIGTIGFEYHVTRYELAPRATNRPCWSIGRPRFEGDVWTCATTLEQWTNDLGRYDYVIVGRADAEFWNQFGSLFDVRHRIAYAVDKTDATVRLRALPQPPLN